MSRLTPYLGVLSAILVFVFVASFSNDATVERVPATVVTSTASSTFAVVAGFTVPQLVLPNLVSATTSSETTSQSSQSAPIKKVTPKVAAPAPVTPTTPKVIPIALPSASPALRASATALINALVNIICYVPANSGLHSISASGVTIDPKGIILTNAHVAQYFLLADRDVSCTIRTGSPAVDTYQASLIYISPAWIRANPTVLTQMNPIGTGENDFALLAITSIANTQPIISTFPYVPLATDPISPNTPVAIASYGAQFLQSDQIQSALFPTLVYGAVKEVFTFAVNTIDVLAFSGSAVAQEGSSGGGIVNESGKLVGTITTSAVDGAISTRSLDAITASYIRAEFASETGRALDILLANPVANSINTFAKIIPALESIITAHL